MTEHDRKTYLFIINLSHVLSCELPVHAEALLILLDANHTVNWPDNSPAWRENMQPRVASLAAALSCM